MSEGDDQPLPQGWASATIDELLGPDGMFVDGDWVESKDQDPNGDVRLIQLADVGDGVFRDRSCRFLTCAKAEELRCTFLASGDLLIARMPDPLGRACTLPDLARKSVTVVDVCIVRLGSDVEPRWLMHQLNAPRMRRHVDALQSGSTRARISRANLARLRLPIPPVAEQRRISEAIDELLSDLDAGIASFTSAREKLAAYRASVLNVAVTGALTAGWRAAHPDVEPASALLDRILVERRRRWEEEQLAAYHKKGQEPPRNWKARYKEPCRLEVAPSTSLPPTWHWATLDSLIVKGPQNGIYVPSTNYGAGTRILRIDDFQDGWVRPLGELQRVHIADDERRTYALAKNDLVINRVNSMTHLGKCLVVSDGLEGTLFESNMMRLALSEGIIPAYVELFLQSTVGRRLLTKDAKWAVNQASINQQDVRRTPFAVPPREEQRTIVDLVEEQLSEIDRLETGIEEKLKSAQALRQSILHHAFTGRLVPQDPNDEPASELLKRMAAEREACGVAKKKEKAKKTTKKRTKTA